MENLFFQIIWIDDFPWKRVGAPGLYELLQPVTVSPSANLLMPNDEQVGIEMLGFSMKKMELGWIVAELCWHRFMTIKYFLMLHH